MFRKKKETPALVTIFGESVISEPWNTPKGLSGLPASIFHDVNRASQSKGAFQQEAENLARLLAPYANPQNLDDVSKHELEKQLVEQYLEMADNILSRGKTAKELVTCFQNKNNMMSDDIFTHKILYRLTEWHELSTITISDDDFIKLFNKDLYDAVNDFVKKHKTVLAVFRENQLHHFPGIYPTQPNITASTGSNSSSALFKSTESRDANKTAKAAEKQSDMHANSPPRKSMKKK